MIEDPDGYVISFGGRPAARTLIALALSSPTQSPSSIANPLVGNWKLNAKKSDVPGDKLVIKRLAGDEMQLDTAGMSYKFKIDGKPYEAFFTAKAAWKQVDKNTWHVAGGLCQIAHGAFAEAAVSE